MKKMILGVFAFIFLVLGFAIFLIVLYTPVKTDTTFLEDGILFSEDGQASTCQVSLSGTLVTYRLNVKPSSFYSDPIRSYQGLIVDDTRYISRVSLGWPDAEDDYVSYIFNGTRFITNRDLSFVVVLFPGESTDEKQVAVAPASDIDQALAIIEDVINNSDLAFSSPSAIAYLEEAFG